MVNKGISEANKIAILGAMASEFGVSAAVPTKFDGIPVVNNLSATFYYFIGDRQEDDIDNLWKLFEIALAYADGDYTKKNDFSTQ